MSDAQRATTWRLLLQQPDLAERIVLLPIELQRSLGALLEAAMDMAQEAYSINYGQDSDPDLGRRVQSSSGTGSVRTTRNGAFSKHLTRRIPALLDDIRTDIRKKLCFDHDPRSGPRFG